MDYALPERQSLKWMALRKIAIVVWDSKNGKHLASKIYFSASNDTSFETRLQWRKIEDALMIKIEELHIPAALKKELTHYIFASGWEFIMWFHYHVNCDNRIRFIPNHFFWTPYGTIDARKTAEAIVHDTTLDIVLRYKFACLYFFEREISELRAMAKNSNGPGVSLFDRSWRIKYNHRGAVVNLPTKFQYFALRESEAGVRFCFRKLSDEQRKTVPLIATGIALDHCNANADWITKTKFPSVLWFLLSTMDKETQTSLLRDKALRVLQCFLYWPYQSFFIETAMRLQNFLSPQDFVDLLEVLAIKLMLKFKDFDYQQLFMEFWQQGTESQKKFVVSNCTSGCLVYHLFLAGEQEIISQIFSNASVAEKESLIFSEAGKLIYQYLVSESDWVMLKYLVYLCIPSEEKALKLKKLVMEYQNSTYVHLNFKSNGKVFIQILNDFLKEKWITDDDEDKPAKKFCR